MRSAPYPTRSKAYGHGLLALARRRAEVVCLSGDLTRQCEVDLFQDALPDRFIHAGMAEAHMMGMAGALARRGHIPFVHTFGVFATRRPFDQIVNAIGYPRLPVRIIGFMPGVSSPGGPSHQAVDDMALMRAVPGMTVVDVADAVEAAQVAAAVVDVPGPVYVRLRRGDTPVVFDDADPLDLHHARLLRQGDAVALISAGMMLPAVLAAADTLDAAGMATTVLHVPVVKPLDAASVVAAAARAQVVLSVENHSIVGGLGSAVAEALAEAGSGRRLVRVGLADTYAEGARDAAHLFTKYGLSTQAVVDAAWVALGRGGPPPAAALPPAEVGEYAPV